ncbi:hypothetical protein [Streptomyces sp. NPDC021212]|uniref:hypothetical protein n=1 Tax=Streptomyces sp. NPDC021212 TaxID=3365118 RepID=UPI0037A46404
MAYFGQLREVVDRFPDVIAPIDDDDLHMTIQSVRQFNTEGARVDDTQLALAARLVQQELEGMAPFDIEIGPARAAGSAGVVDIWPQAGPAELNRRVRAGLEAAGMVLPPAEDHFWCHISCGYGLHDTDSPELAARSDQFASEIGTSIRPARTQAQVNTVWLVWEQQHPQRNTYSFECMHALHLRVS